MMSHQVANASKEIEVIKEPNRNPGVENTITEMKNSAHLSKKKESAT